MGDLINQIAQRAKISIISQSGEALNDQMIELAIQDSELGTALCSWFNLNLYQVAFLMSEYKKLKKVQKEIALKGNVHSSNDSQNQAQLSLQILNAPKDEEGQMKEDEEAEEEKFQQKEKPKEIEKQQEADPKNAENQEGKPENSKDVISFKNSLIAVNREIQQLCLAQEENDKLKNQNENTNEILMAQETTALNIISIFNKGDMARNASIKSFQAFIKQKSLEEDKAKIKVLYSNQKRKTITFGCYFSNDHKNTLFPSIMPAEHCKFKMVWKYDEENSDSYIFKCIDIDKDHNHYAIPENDSSSLIECEILDDNIRDEAIRYYLEGFTVKQLHMMINSNHKANISKEKFKNFIDYYKKKYILDISFESLIENENYRQNSIVENSREKKRFFITDSRQIELWSHLEDVILIDSTYKVHDKFRCAVFILSVDSNGSNLALAMALCENETESDYKWIFRNFLKYFYKPQVIFVDRNKAQYKALYKTFKKTKIIFCMWHIQRNVIIMLRKNGYTWEEFSQHWWSLYYSIDAPTFINKWNTLLDNFPLLKGCAAFKELGKIKAQWARYSCFHYPTMGIKTTSRSESFNSQIKRAIKTIKRNKNCRILTVFNDIIEFENETFLKQINSQKAKLIGSYKGNLFKSWTTVFTKYSLFFSKSQ